ncbi:MAG: lysophospholipid acyltransferase family protein [Candidatus Xenobia bacterium]
MAKSRAASTSARPPIGILLLSIVLWIVGIPTFLICSSIVLVATFFAPPRRLFRLMGACAAVIPRAVGIRFRYEGTELIPRGPAIWVGNHVNNFDPMALLAITPSYLIALEKATHFKWFIYGPMVRRYGNLPVGSGSSEQTLESMRRAEEMLKQGVASVMVFPEGTRSRTGTLGRFRRGAFVLAVRAGVPILPFALKGAYELYGKGPYLHPGTITLQFLPPIETRGYTEQNVDDLVRQVRACVEEAVFGPRHAQQEKAEEAAESSENRTSSGEPIQEQDA